MHLLGAVLIGVVLGRGMGRFPITPETSYLAWGGGVLIGAVVALYIIKKYPMHVWRGIGAVALFGVLVEYVGILTCYPYGCFQYGQLTGPSFLGTFPYILLIIRPLLVVCAVQFIPTSIQKNRKKLLFAASWLVLLDIFLDPVAVDAGIWEYVSLSGTDWYGVPLSNYLGRIPVSIVSVGLLLWGSKELQGDRAFRFLGVMFLSQYVSYFLLFIV